MLHGAGIWIPTFAPSYVGKYTSTMEFFWVSEIGGLPIPCITVS
jgi:hypothetical protein